MSVVESFDLAVSPVAAANQGRHFKFDKDLKRTSLISMHQALSKALENFPGAAIAMERFCRALSKSDTHDRLVDLCISLESLLDGSTELRYRFALMHALISERDAAKRAEAFKLFQDFYDARSKVVHGENAPAKVAAIEAQWEKLLFHARTSLAYYFAYLSTNNRESWNTHVKNICLGIESPSVGD